MIYYIKEIHQNGENKRTAGVKARDDLDVIFKQEGIKDIEVSTIEENRETQGLVAKLITHKRIAQKWGKSFSLLKRGDIVCIQFPAVEHSLYLANVIKKVKKRGVKVILIIHDLELFRYAKRKDFSFYGRIRVYLEEKTILKMADCIVVHNQRMRDSLAVKANISTDKMVVLGIFDYLIPDYGRREGGRIEKEGPIVISGNLLPSKAGYAYHLPATPEYNLYGVNYNKGSDKNIHYNGSFSPDDIPFTMNGSFGLVWDGESEDTCNGTYGEYLRINNPHKASLYLASGMPVMIWKEAALAKFIEENKVGVTIERLSDISGVLDNMTKDEYNNIKNNVKQIQDKLIRGVFMRNALKECIYICK